MKSGMLLKVDNPQFLDPFQVVGGLFITLSQSDFQILFIRCTQQMYKHILFYKCPMNH